jgi:hypothetical protein
MTEKWPTTTDRYMGSRCEKCNAPVFCYHEGKESESSESTVLTPICPTCGNLECRFAPSELRVFEVMQIV